MNHITVFSGFSREMPDETQLKVTVKLCDPGQAERKACFPLGRNTVVCILYMVFWVKCFYTPLW